MCRFRRIPVANEANCIDCRVPVAALRPADAHVLVDAGDDALLGFATKLLLPCVMVQSGGDGLQRPVRSASAPVSWRSAGQGLEEVVHVSSCGWVCVANTLS